MWFEALFAPGPAKKSKRSREERAGRLSQVPDPPLVENLRRLSAAQAEKSTGNWDDPAVAKAAGMKMTMVLIIM
jgi:hypothetical protein